MDKKNAHLTAQELTLVALAVAFLTVCSWISIPAGDVPITLQTLAIFVITGLFSTKLSLLALSVYLIMGMVGLPVFAGMTGGLGRIVGPTGGYLIGFYFTVALIGTFSRQFGRHPLVTALSLALSLIICYAFGTLWFAAIHMGGINGVSVVTALVKCVLPYLLPDAVKLAAALWIVKRVSPLLPLH